jgi:hypothetical protein
MVYMNLSYIIVVSVYDILVKLAAGILAAQSLAKLPRFKLGP